MFATMNLNHYTTIMTPTLTPNTLRTFEESLGMTDLTDNESMIGSFVPPLPFSSQAHVNTWNGGRIVSENEDLEIKETLVFNIAHEEESTRSDSGSATLSNASKKRETKSKRGGKRAAGGRKPRGGGSKGTPEEDERRQLRRERNKEAAARCRQRRVDHTRSLEEETERLEAIKKSIQDQITSLHKEKEELEYVLDAHSTDCSKSAPPSQPRERPSTLDLKPTTPSNGLGVEIDPWAGSTGLTPLFANGSSTSGLTPFTPNTTLAILSGFSLVTPRGEEAMEELKPHLVDL